MRLPQHEEPETMSIFEALFRMIIVPIIAIFLISGGVYFLWWVWGCVLKCIKWVINLI